MMWLAVIIICKGAIISPDTCPPSTTGEWFTERAECRQEALGLMRLAERRGHMVLNGYCIPVDVTGSQRGGV
jgi:hypothetical protein